MPYKDPDKARECQRRSRERNRERVRAYNKAWAAANPEKRTAIQRRYQFKHYYGILLKKAKLRAGLAALPFAIHERDLAISICCPWLDIPLQIHGPADNRPTLDRVDNSKGYVVGNVEVISWRANRLKSNATLAELEKMGSAISST